MSLTIIASANDLLSKLGIEGSDPTAAPALAQQDVIIAMNAAGQMLQRAGQDFFTRSRLTVGLSAGTAIYPLGQNIQAVLGPVRLNDQIPLAALTSRGELDQFDRIFLGLADYGSSPGVPIAYFPEFLNNGATVGDPEQVNIWFAPIPATNPGFVVVEVIDAFASITLANIGSSSLLPVARNYAETIFQPIARLAITRSSQFSRPDLLKQITDDAQSAMQQLGTAGGFPDVDQQLPPRQVHG